MKQFNIKEALQKLYSGKKMIKLPEGGMSFAYEVDENIIRIPKTEYAENGYLCEKAILDYLHATIDCTQLPDISIKKEPFFHTVHRKIPGIYWSEKEYLSKSNAVRDALAEDCAVFFAELHASDVTKIHTRLLELHPIQKNMELYLKDFFTPHEMGEIVKFTNPLFVLPKDDLTLVHHDFYPDNFLLRDDYRLNGVLDFGNSGIYNYMFDFKALVSWERGINDFFHRIASRYTRICGRHIDIKTIQRIDIHNYISLLLYFTKNKHIKDEKINVVGNLRKHVDHIKKKMCRYA